MNDVMKVVKSSGAAITDQQFDNSCSMIVSIRLADADKLNARLSDISGLTFIL